MDVDVVVERVRQIASVRDDAGADADTIGAALRSSAALKAWLVAGDAELALRLRPQVSFPEKTIADCTRTSLGDAVKANERADTLAAVPAFADALDHAVVTPGHVDAITRATKGLDSEQRADVLERVGGLVDVAAAATVREFGRRLDFEVRSVQRDGGLSRFERQRRATAMRSWTDGEGMVCLSARFDPVTGVRVVARIDAGVETIFAEATPDTCPTDPIEKQRHLAALALARILTDDARVGTKPGRPEFVVVVDTSQPDGGGGPVVDWGIPVEVPARVLADLIDAGNVHTVVVRNGVVLHAQGELDLGRTTRLANRAQRRALRALYGTCAVPGCTVHYDRCKLHHVVWWRHGGRSDLDNLLPLCSHHHAKVHTDGWELALASNREQSIRFPDGTVHTTGPPGRRAA